MKLFLFCFCCLLVTIVTGQDSTMQYSEDSMATNAFRLGEVVVTGKKRHPASSFVSAHQMEVFSKPDVSKALNMLPGITLSSVGPRNEAMIYLRGFDLRQVPLLIDGIPVYVPYDGYVDLARFTTFDIAEINVSKGYTSVLYGPNALGGAINLISRKPVRKFEFNGATGWLSGGYRSNINIGSNLGKFYLQAGASRLKRDSFPLSDNFQPSKTEEGGWRNNSWNTDDKYNLKVAYTPNSRSEYALSYIYQHGKKGTPVYSGQDTLNSQFKNPRFWQWPYWDKQSLYFISNTVIDTTQYIKTRFYYDRFKNQLNSYDDATYSKISRPYAFKSFYNDYSFGAILEYGKTISTIDNIKGTLQYKNDVHRENNEGEPVRTMSDRTITAGIENELAPVQHLIIRTGISYNQRASLKAQNYNTTTKKVTDYPSNTNDAFNIQGSIEYSFKGMNVINLSVARKTRFATSKDRYSYRLGTAVPNPDLEAEYSMNYELGYKGYIIPRLNFEAALFYSRIQNTISMVSNVELDPVRNVWQSQLQNVGEAKFSGVEATVSYQFLKTLSAGVNYTFIERRNMVDESIHFTDVPKNKVFGFVHYELPGKVSIQFNSEYNSKRYSTTYGAVAGSFFLLNGSASVHVWKWFSVEAGINNIADKNYSLVEGYVEPGSNYFVNLLYRL
ncbi:TonB-dependent receptor plug domain-containing protein [Flavitalea sp.]|nr:TonB-dependent receptor [Flavitalea sp.]